MAPPTDQSDTAKLETAPTDYGLNNVCLLVSGNRATPAGSFPSRNSVGLLLDPTLMFGHEVSLEAREIRLRAGQLVLHEADLDSNLDFHSNTHRVSQSPSRSGP